MAVGASSSFLSLMVRYTNDDRRATKEATRLRDTCNKPSQQCTSQYNIAYASTKAPAAAAKYKTVHTNTGPRVSTDYHACGADKLAQSPSRFILLSMRPFVNGDTEGMYTVMHIIYCSHSMFVQTKCDSLGIPSAPVQFTTNGVHAYLWIWRCRSKQPL